MNIFLIWLFVSASRYIEALTECAFEDVKTDRGTRIFFLGFALAWPVVMAVNILMFVRSGIKSRFKNT